MVMGEREITRAMLEHAGGEDDAPTAEASPSGYE